MSNATKIDLYLKNPDGTPMTNTCVAVKPVRASFWSTYVGVVEDVEITFTTDNTGYVQMELWPLPYPYYLTYSDDDESIPGQFLFYVPAVDTVVNFQDLIVTKASASDTYEDTVLQQIIAAKVATQAAAAAAQVSANTAESAASNATNAAQTADQDAIQTGLDRAAMNQTLNAMTAMWTSLQEAVVKIQAINLQNKLVLGGYTLWVDANGKLRIFEGTPTSDTDGVVVGTQTA
ncbi:hypothetical protein ACUND2_22285 [Serratia sp. IR-2025]